MADLVLPKCGPRRLGPLILLQDNFGSRTIFCLAYFGPTLGLIFAARNGPRTKLALGTSSGCLK